MSSEHSDEPASKWEDGDYEMQLFGCDIMAMVSHGNITDVFAGELDVTGVLTESQTTEIQEEIDEQHET